MMGPFDWFIDFGWFGFHVIPALLLLILFTIVCYQTHQHGIWSFVFAMAASSLSIQTYESVHAITQYMCTGTTGRSAIINIAIAVSILFFLVCINSRFNVLNKPEVVVSTFALFILSMVALAFSGFFSNYPYSIRFGAEWAISKLLVNFFALSLFRYENDMIGEEKR